MATRTPIEVVEAYNYELWNSRDYQLGEELIADEVIRHYPGSVETLSRDDAIQRVKDAYARVFAEIEFTIHKMLLDGEYVTLLWEMRAKTLEGEDFVYSSIEVFRVVDGKIREFWNPTHIQETNGVWG
ncbi:MAG: ester cyclase [Gammaproteobacteria bacterium]|nr:ester cyclase [Gammaproteobacteria bacterium]